MLDKKDIEKILCENNGEKFLLVMQKSIKPFVIIDPKKKAEELYAKLTDTQPSKIDTAYKNKLREEYRFFEKELVEYWNTFVEKFPSLGAVLKVSAERRKHLKARFESGHFRSNYKKAIEQIAFSKFLLGKGGKTWKVSLDFIIQNDTNYVKMLENKYRDEGITESGISQFM